jgi:hypothetical protein
MLFRWLFNLTIQRYGFLFNPPNFFNFFIFINVRELIKNILKEYIEPKPILVCEIVIDNNLNEQEFIRQLEKNNNNIINLYKNAHSMDSVGSSSSFQRVDPDEIIDSIMGIENTIIKSAKKILESCITRCSINVIDNSIGIDYHMWLNKKTNSNNIQITINTSIHHPNHLKFRSNTSPTIVIDKFGDVFTRNI